MCKHRPERLTCRYCKYSYNPNLFDSGCFYPEPVGEKMPIDMKNYRHWKRTTGKRAPYRAVDIDWIPIEKED